MKYFDQNTNLIMSNMWFYRQRRSFDGPNLNHLQTVVSKARSGSLSSTSTYGSNRYRSQRSSLSSHYSSTTTLQRISLFVPPLQKRTIDIPAIDAESTDNIANLFPRFVQIFSHLISGIIWNTLFYFYHDFNPVQYEFACKETYS